MKVKTFRGASTREVLDQVKSILGQEAVILNTRSFYDQDKQVCEVMAGVDNGQDAKQESAPPENGSWAVWENWRRELFKLKSSIFTLIRPHINLESLTHRQQLAMKYLEQEGVSPDVLLSVWQKLQNNPNASILGILNKMIKVRPWSTRLWKQKCHALAGPHGVGKTSAVLRMALDVKQKDPNSSICLVNADLHQGKGRLFLKHYADLSDFEYLEARNAKDWSRVASKFREFDKIFVDLPGMHKGFDLQTWWQESGLQVLDEVCVHLALSPTYCSMQLQDFLRRFATPNLAGLIWTKLDEACMFGDMVNIGKETGLPVSLFTHSPGLRNGMTAADAKLFWRVVFQHKLPQEG